MRDGVDRREAPKVKYEAAKAKAHVCNNSIRTKLTGGSLEQFLAKNRLHQQKLRGNKRNSYLINFHQVPSKVDNHSVRL